MVSRQWSGVSLGEGVSWPNFWGGGWGVYGDEGVEGGKGTGRKEGMNE